MTPAGSLDGSFAPALSTGAQVYALAVQVDAVEANGLQVARIAVPKAGTVVATAGATQWPVPELMVPSLADQVTVLVATPGFENGFDIHTDAAAPWNRPAPPPRITFAWLQPRVACVEFHELLSAPTRSKCPSWALPMPSALLVQFEQV